MLLLDQGRRHEQAFGAQFIKTSLVFLVCFFFLERKVVERESSYLASKGRKKITFARNQSASVQTFRSSFNRSIKGIGNDFNKVLSRAK